MRFVVVLAVVVLIVAAVVSAEEDGKKARSASKKDREHGSEKDTEHGSKKDREHGSKNNGEHVKKHRSRSKKEREHSGEKEREYKKKSTLDRKGTFETKERQPRAFNIPYNQGDRLRGAPVEMDRHHAAPRHGGQTPPPSVDLSNEPGRCPIDGQIRVCNNPCVSLTCDNYNTEAVNWTDCIYDKPNGIVQATADECYHGKGTWSECFCHPGYVMDEQNGACVREGECGRKMVPTTTTDGDIH